MRDRRKEILKYCERDTGIYFRGGIERERAGDTKGDRQKKREKFKKKKEIERAIREKIQDIYEREKKKRGRKC